MRAHSLSLPAAPPSFARLFELARAGIAGAGATLVDLGVLSLLVSGFGVSPRIASIPALLAGGVANFIGNRHFAFRARQGSLLRQALLYTAIEAVALALNGMLYDFALRTLPGAAHAYGWVRLATSHLVFLCWSYPLWRRAFATPAAVSVDLQPQGRHADARGVR